MGGRRLFSIVCLVISIAVALPASALADETVIEAETAGWSGGTGEVYGPGQSRVDSSNTNVAGYWLSTNGTRTSGSVTTTKPLTGVSVRLRTEQNVLCQNNGNPQFSLKVDGVARATWTLAANTSYSTYTVDAGTPLANYDVPPGPHTFAVALNNDAPPTCDRALWIDKVILVSSQIFPDSSWRNAPLASDAPLAADQSPAAALKNQVRDHGSYVNDADLWNVPVYTVPSGQARVPVVQDTRWDQYFGADATAWNNQLGSVPIPANAKASWPKDGTSDGEFIEVAGVVKKTDYSVDWSDREIAIYQPSSDTLWELYHLVKYNGQWAATDGGRISHVSQAENYDQQPFPSNKYHGVAATRIPLLATLQRTNEVLTGEIKHPVSIHVPNAMGPGQAFQVLPALANDGDFMTADAIKEGTRFRLPASFDPNSLPAGYVRAFAKAARDYGIIVTDKDCKNTMLDPQPTTPDCDMSKNPRKHAVTTIVEDPYPAYGTTDPYGIDESTALAGFPWDQLQVLPPTP